MRLYLAALLCLFSEKRVYGCSKFCINQCFCSSFFFHSVVFFCWLHSKLFVAFGHTPPKTWRWTTCYRIIEMDCCNFISWFFFSFFFFCFFAESLLFSFRFSGVVQTICAHKRLSGYIHIYVCVSWSENY